MEKLDNTNNITTSAKKVTEKYSPSIMTIKILSGHHFYLSDLADIPKEPNFYELEATGRNRKHNKTVHNEFSRAPAAKNKLIKTE